MSSSFFPSNGATERSQHVCAVLPSLFSLLFSPLFHAHLQRANNGDRNDLKHSHGVYKGRMFVAHNMLDDITHWVLDCCFETVEQLLWLLIAATIRTLYAGFLVR